MTDYRSFIHKIDGATQLVQQRDGWWMIAPTLDVLDMAHKMKIWGARFSTMTGVMLPENETAVIYHFILDGDVYNIKVFTKKNRIPSISVILPAAEWIEREIQDLFRVEFENHPNPDSLLRPVQLQAGFFREPGGAVRVSER